jgi:hypothetical protein
MNILEKNKYLMTLMGECIHDLVYVIGEEYMDSSNISFKACDYEIKCMKCGEIVSTGSGIDKEEAIKCAKVDLAYEKKAYNFSTWEGFGRLYTWSKQQEWWELFLIISRTELNIELKDLIDPIRFMDAIIFYTSKE